MTTGRHDEDLPWWSVGACDCCDEPAVELHDDGEGSDVCAACDPRASHEVRRLAASWDESMAAIDAAEEGPV